MPINLEDILSRVNKPARYIGNEINSVRKNLTQDLVKVALCFPDLYEIGMSHLGFRIIYGVLNNQKDCVCERLFSPEKDLENILRTENIPLFSLESKLPLKEFDVLGFSLCYELTYTNVLNILDLAGLALRQNERSGIFPLIIGGGNCCLNPEPLADFFDLFVIGEAEEAILEVVNKIKEYKNSQRNYQKEDLLSQLSKIEGVYVPSFYEAEYSGGGVIKKFYPKAGDAPDKIKKRFIKNLDNSYYPTNWLLPYVSIVHDRISLEIMRGCPNRCLFCQARASFLPLRIRSLPNLINLAKLLYKASGYEEISLLSLSTSDYPHIYELVKSLIEEFKDKALSISLPSLRAKSIIGELVEFITKVRKTSLTFAPEAGTERLRRVIGKDFNLNDLMSTIKIAKDLGYKRLKLYFMIGLPTEKEEDLDGIVDFVSGISNYSKLNITLSISNFTPKPHTPFQWLAMEGIDSLRKKQEYLRSKIKPNNQKIKIDFHDISMSYLECVFSRGDRRLSEVISCAFKSGARFDSWYNSFNLNLWLGAFKINSIDPNFYCRVINKEEVLPWGHIDVIAVSEQNMLTKAKI